jgi:hypothetical protein
MKSLFALILLSSIPASALADGTLTILNGTAANPQSGGTSAPIAQVTIAANGGQVARLTLMDRQYRVCNIPVSLIQAAGLNVADLAALLNPAATGKNVTVRCDGSGSVIAPGLSQTHASTRFELDSVEVQ